MPGQEAKKGFFSIFLNVKVEGRLCVLIRIASLRRF